MDDLIISYATQGHHVTVALSFFGVVHLLGALMRLIAALNSRLRR
jgi:hypothetical protein